MALQLEKQTVQLVGAGADRRRLALALTHRGPQPADGGREPRTLRIGERIVIGLRRSEIQVGWPSLRGAEL